MPALLGLLYAALVGAAAAFATGVARREAGRGAGGAPRPGAAELGVGLVTDFFDTLGIGSFAPTTALFRALRLVPDDAIPGTLMVGHALPTIVQALIYVTVIEVDPATLVALIAAAMAGAWLGAGVVAGWPRRPIQAGMGAALLAASAVMLAGMLGLFPAGGSALALRGARLAVGLAGNFLFGALMNLGIGAYAPSLVMFGLLGMNVKAIFPIMMGSCALLMPLGGIRFVARRRYAPRAALGLTLGGVPGVLVAAWVVKELPLATLRWLVLVVVVYTAIAMLRAAARDAATGANWEASARVVSPPR